MISAFHRIGILPTISSRRTTFIVRHAASAGSSKKAVKGKANEKGNKEEKVLVIVESPAKARTIQSFLNEFSKNYVVESSMGHILELASKKEHYSDDFKPKVISENLGISTLKFGVDVFDKFRPYHVLLHGKENVVKKLQALAKDSDRILLATDEDREGEAISWDLVNVLKPTVPYQRAVFHEITKTAIEESFRNPREIDFNLVNAREARSILDKIAGYTLSPLLWRMIASELSAGRVQSCALHMICEREKLRWKFVPSNYYALAAAFHIPEIPSVKDRPFIAKLTKWNDKKVAVDKDFDGETGKVRSDDIIVLDDEKNAELMQWLCSGSPKFSIFQRTERNSSQYPAPPYITSTLQQDASRKLGFSTTRTMSVAQKLYENGYITYMRTDSPVLSSSAAEIVKAYVINHFGQDYLQGSRKSKSAPKNAQEAHEAIRPAAIDGHFKTAAELNLDPDSSKLYDLIYKRTIASQMKESKAVSVSYVINAADKAGSSATFRFTQSRMTDEGYQIIWQKKADPTALEHPILNLKKGQRIELYGKKIPKVNVFSDMEDDAEADDKDEEQDEQDVGNTNEQFPGIVLSQHHTRAPNRYSVASFIAELEEKGVGRPSTYASILKTLETRNFALIDKKTVVPTLLGVMVSNFLEHYFSGFINTGFTAEMEKRLDLIASGEDDKVKFLQSFYFGTKSGDNSSDPTTLGLLNYIEQKLSKNEFNRDFNELQYPLTADLGRFKYTKRGLFFIRNDAKQWIKLPEHFLADIRTITRESILECIENAPKAPESDGDEEEFDTEGITMGKLDRKTVKIHSGPYGKYFQVGKDKVSIPTWMKIPDNEKDYASSPDPNVFTLVRAKEFLELPKVIGIHPVAQKEIKLSCTHGRLYASIGFKESIHLPDGISVSDVLENKNKIMENVIIPGLSQFVDNSSVGIWKDIPEEYYNLITKGATTSNGQPREAAIMVKSGRFGPYFSCGAVIASGLKNMENVQLEQAIEAVTRKCKRLLDPDANPTRRGFRSAGAKSPEENKVEPTPIVVEEATTTKKTKPSKSATSEDNPTEPTSVESVSASKKSKRSKSVESEKTRTPRKKVETEAEEPNNSKPAVELKSKAAKTKAKKE